MERKRPLLQKGYVHITNSKQRKHRFHSKCRAIGRRSILPHTRVSAAGKSSFLETSSVTLDLLFAEHNSIPFPHNELHCFSRQDLPTRIRVDPYLFIRADPNLIGLRSAGTMPA